MSRYEWEAGSIKIPSKDYRNLRKEIISYHNQYQLELLANAKVCLLACKKEVKGLTGHKLFDKLNEVASKFSNKPEDIVSLLSKHTENGLKLFSPKKKDLNIKNISAGCLLEYEDFSISFSDDEHSVYWNVPENNHAIACAHDHPVARKLFSKLNRINWVRGTGGRIIGNDEYNRDSDYEGGGGNYVTISYGTASSRI